MMTSVMITFAVTLASVACVFATEPSQIPRTTFQIHTPWSPQRDLQSDAAIIYGSDDTTKARIESFKNQGYQTEFMTGVAWGNYADYVEGKFDGKNHMDDAQVRRDGSRVMHDPSTPYFVPSPSYREYLKTKLAHAIDAGATAIYLEEPEFWAFAGYEESFKREYKKFYHEDWQAPHQSVDARFRVDHLKYILYRDTIDELFRYAKDYAKRKGADLHCYVATHSLISYAQIRMVSPMSSLMNLTDCDGYIAQVWTGTARHPNTYQGITKERTFESAYFEYAQMASMVRPTGRVCYFLADPIEDDPNHGWDDYEANYKRTLVASLMQADVNHYEIAPWPNRVFELNYPATEKDARAARNSPKSASNRIPIPSTYATTLQVCFNALADMPTAPSHFESTIPSVAVLTSDTMMFQRDDPSPSDSHLNNFFALAMPLIKQGIPAKVVQLETLPTPNALKNIDILFMTYEGMKPLDENYNKLLANYVRAGGTLIVVDDQQDPYNKMRAWWNSPPLKFVSPLDHLLQTLGPDREKVVFDPSSPTKLAHDPNGAKHLLDLLNRALTQRNQPPLAAQSHLVLHRGPYVIAANVDESSNSKPATIRGTFVDLFNANLPIVTNPTIAVGEVKLLREVGDQPQVLASASRIQNFAISNGRITFESRGPENTHCVTRIRLDRKPRSVGITDGSNTLPYNQGWDPTSSTLLLEYENHARPLVVTIDS